MRHGTQPSINHRSVWQIALPMVIANISTPLLGMVDTAVVGHLDDPHYLGAVAIGSMIFTFLFWSFGFLRMATTGLTSQAHGAEDQLRIHSVLWQSMMLATLIALILLCLQWPVAQMAFALIDSSDQVALYARYYFDIRIWSAPATLLNYAIIGWLIGREAARSALWLVLVINLTNIVFDLLLVYWLGMKTDGVALASVIAEYTGLAVALVILRRHGITLPGYGLLVNTWQSLADFRAFSIHGNLLLRTLCLIFSFAFFTTQGARQGDVVLAANAVLLNFITFMAFVLDGFANATEVLTGKAIGRKNRHQMIEALLLSGFWAVLMAVLFSVIYSVFGMQIIGLLTSIDSVMETAQTYLIWLIIAPLLAVWTYLFDGLFVGATRGREMRNTMLAATLLCYLPAWYLLQPLGNDGLWLALLIFLASRG
ncbi:MATE family efflux transporter [Methylophaga lonarensis]|nr:MATE family efflux transporter [Methylophaga lonarensis]